MKFLARVMVVSWRNFFLTVSVRVKRDAQPDTILTAPEIDALDRIDAARSKPRLRGRTLVDYLRWIAMLGGYPDRCRDPPPGNMIVRRGLTRLHDFPVVADPLI